MDDKPLLGPAKAAMPYMYTSCHSMMMLLCICFLTFGAYWVYDTPGAIYRQLQAWFGGESHYTASQNLALYSVYSWPNTVLAFFGGYIIDRITGVRAGTILFTSLIAIGQGLFAVGVQWRMYWLCVVGRLIFGLGGESLTVAQNTYTLRWFEGPNLALVFGLVLAFARIGSSVNFALTPIIAKSGVPLAVWFGTGLCGLSLLVCIVGACLDKSGAYILQRREEDAKALLAEDGNSSRASSSSELGVPEEVTPEEEVSIWQVRKFPLRAWILFLNCMIFYNGILSFYAVASDIIQNTGPYQNIYYQLPDDNIEGICLDFNEKQPNYYEKETSSLAACEWECSQMDTCSGYQLTDTQCLWFTPAFKPAPANGTFHEAPGGAHVVVEAQDAEGSGSSCYKRSRTFMPATSTLFLAIPNFVSIFASPMLGGVVDRKGRALMFIMLSSVMLMMAHIAFLSNFLEWFFIHPVIIMLWLGFAYAMGAAAIWPIAALIVPPSLVGTAYGAMTSVQNLGLAAVPLAIGTIQDSPGIQGTRSQYVVPIMIFIGCAATSFLLALLNLALDKSAGNGVSIMNASAAERKAMKAKLDAAKLAGGDGVDPILTPKLLSRVQQEEKTAGASGRRVNSENDTSY